MQLRVRAAEAVAEAVHAAEALLEGHRALHAGAHHVEARLAVTAVLRRALDVRPAALEAVDRNAVRRRIDRRSHEGLHAVRDRVHAGGCGEEGRQAQRELGIAKGGLRHEMPAVKAQLAAVVDDDDRAARDLAAGACGRGHGDQRSDPFADLRAAAFDRRVGRERSGMRRRDRHALGEVDAGAATDRDQAVAAFGDVDVGRRPDGALGGI